MFEGALGRCGKGQPIGVLGLPELGKGGCQAGTTGGPTHSLVLAVPVVAKSGPRCCCPLRPQLPLLPLPDSCPARPAFPKAGAMAGCQGEVTILSVGRGLSPVWKPLAGAWPSSRTENSCPEKLGRRALRFALSLPLAFPGHSLLSLRLLRCVEKGGHLLGPRRQSFTCSRGEEERRQAAHWEEFSGAPKVAKV